MNKEYVVWGVAPLGLDEEILYTLAKSKEQAEKVCIILEEQEGCVGCRVQIIDFANNTNLFKKAVTV